MVLSLVIQILGFMMARGFSSLYSTFVIEGTLSLCRLDYFTTTPEVYISFFPPLHMVIGRQQLPL